MVFQNPLFEYVNTNVDGPHAMKGKGAAAYWMHRVGLYNIKYYLVVDNPATNTGVNLLSQGVSVSVRIMVQLSLLVAALLLTRTVCHSVHVIPSAKCASETKPNGRLHRWADFAYTIIFRYSLYVTPAALVLYVIVTPTIYTLAFVVPAIFLFIFAPRAWLARLLLPICAILCLFFLALYCTYAGEWYEQSLRAVEANDAHAKYYYAKLLFFGEKKNIQDLSLDYINLQLGIQALCIGLVCMSHILTHTNDSQQPAALTAEKLTCKDKALEGAVKDANAATRRSLVVFAAKYVLGRKAVDKLRCLFEAECQTPSGCSNVVDGETLRVRLLSQVAPFYTFTANEMKMMRYYLRLHSYGVTSPNGAGEAASGIESLLAGTFCFEDFMILSCFLKIHGAPSIKLLSHILHKMETSAETNDSILASTYGATLVGGGSPAIHVAQQQCELRFPRRVLRVDSDRAAQVRDAWPLATHSALSLSILHCGHDPRVGGLVHRQLLSAPYGPNSLYTPGRVRCDGLGAAPAAPLPPPLVYRIYCGDFTLHHRDVLNSGVKK